MEKLSSRLHTTDKTIAKVEDVLLTILFAVLTCMVLVQVLCRFVFHYSTPWSEELALYLFVMVTLMGAGSCLSHGDHIEINVLVMLYKRIPNKETRIKVGRCFELFRYIVILGVCIFLVYYGFDYTAKIYEMGNSSAAAHVPMWVIYSSTVFGFFMAIVHSVVKIILCFVDYESIADPVVLDGGAAQ